MWAESQTPNEFKSKSEKIGKQGSKCESLKSMPVCLRCAEHLQWLYNNFHTSGKRCERK